MMPSNTWVVLCAGLLPLAGSGSAQATAPLALPTAPSAARDVLRSAHEQADATHLRALEQAYASLIGQAQASPERTRMIQLLLVQLQQLQAHAVDPAILLRAASISLAVAQPDMAARIYQRLAQVNPLHTVQWLEHSAQQYLASGAPGRAATRYEEASKAAQQGVPRRRLILLAMQAHLANSDGRRALRLAKAHAASFASDSEFLQQAVSIAVAQHDLHWAKGTGRKLLALSPRDPVQLERQVQLELATNDLEAARALAQQLVRLQPDSAEQRTRLARIADWSDQPELALQHWQYLARTTPTPEVLDRTLRISMALEQDGLWLRTAHQASMVRPLTAEELQGLGRISERAQVPGPLVEFLEVYGQHHAMSAPQWKALADAQEQLGHYAAALAIWQDKNGLAATDAALASARILLRLERPQQARDALRTQRQQVLPDRLDFWLAHGDLEWDYGSRQDAVDAYQRAWTAGSTNVQGAERLISAWVDQGEWQRAIGLADEAYARLDQPRWLLLAMDAAARAEQWDLLQHAAARAHAVEPLLADSEMYWLLQAHLAAHEQHNAQALDAYRHALALNPDAVPLRVQLLVMALADGLEQDLAQQLQQWQADALQQPDYWPVYAVGRLRLQQLRDSMDWFERQVQLQPQDYPWQSDYLYWLGRIDPLTLEPETRQEVLQRLRLALARPNPGNDRGKLAVLLRLASVARAWKDNTASDAVLQDMLDLGYGDASVFQLLVDSSLSRHDTGAARHWLRSAEERRQELPAYQHLALALQTNDLRRLSKSWVSEALRSAPPTALVPCAAWGATPEALALADRELLDAPLASDERLQAHRDALRQQLSSDVTLGYAARDFASLSLRSSELSGSFATDTARLKFRLAHNTLGGDGLHILSDRVGSEDEATLTTTLQLQDDPIELTLGANARTDNTLLFGRLDWAHALDPRNSMHVDLQLHTLSELSPALRYLGSQDKIAWVLHHTDSESLAGHVGLACQQFTSRSGSFLGQGYRAEAALEKTLSTAEPHWAVRVSGSSDNNRLADGLPSDTLVMSLPGQTIDSVLASHFSTAGLGTTLRWGSPEGLLRHTYGVLDIWAGQQWPGNENAYAVRAGVHLPLNTAGTARVRLEGHYTNVVGGATAQADRGLGLWLQYRF